MMTPQQKYDLGQKLSLLFDGLPIDDVVPILVTALAFAIHQGGDDHQERLGLYEQVARHLLDELVELRYELNDNVHH